MVSLSRGFSSSSGGGVFFNDASLSIEDDAQQLEPIIGALEASNFHTLDTVLVSALHLSLAIGQLVLALVLFVVWPYDSRRCDPYFIILYVQAAHWCISLIIHLHIKNKHNLLRVNGYHEFFRKMYSRSQMPFYIVSMWSAVLLVVAAAGEQASPDFRRQCRSESSYLSPAGYLCGVVGAETLALVAAISFYLSRVVRFNRKKPAPDVLRDEWMISLIQNNYGSGEVGYRERSSQLQDLLEKQADVIRSLRDQSARLSLKVMLLSSGPSAARP
ncbi:transmembrane protein 192 [Bacillus rossius redtenbacheri]|uniref:transmembrane protein 192 n=1 Tax=Bacillus rossius redtenbacheri TaxID=93214 RepID=UPI002FDD9D13